MMDTIACYTDIIGLPEWRCKAYVVHPTIEETANRVRNVWCKLWNAGTGEFHEECFRIPEKDPRTLGEIGVECMNSLCKKHQPKPPRMGTRTHP
jgi:hypothetical protein